MGKKRKKKRKKEKLFELPGRVKQIIWGIIMIVFALLVVLSFFGKAGTGGNYFMKGASFLLGSTVFLLPLILIIAGVTFGSTCHDSLGVALCSFPEVTPK